MKFFSKNHRKNTDVSIPIKLIEASHENELVLEVTTPDILFENLYMNMLIDYASDFEENDFCHYTVTGSTIKLAFSDVKFANDAREFWKDKLKDK